ncbi:hypothetical protein Bhyg_07852 [Pseudolycoriella hygida]|uniref:CCHC-type domain-containing protein n=1 Tax=Pseudolycoriella hygida TaxID=35572 RepID=A0A9Q0N4F0_9DIPT|nr:hypothetical protein Bhyg_07852 [Pseudolycoriella hygida]
MNAEMKGLKVSTSTNDLNAFSKNSTAFQRGRSMASDRYQKRRNNSPELRNRKHFICYNCRKPGHMARNCTEPKRINRFVGEYNPQEDLDKDDLRFRVGSNSIKHIDMVNEEVADPLFLGIKAEDDSGCSQYASKRSWRNERTESH